MKHNPEPPYIYSFAFCRKPFCVLTSFVSTFEFKDQMYRKIPTETSPLLCYT